jgi:molybdate transport system substrate-binding protein
MQRRQFLILTIFSVLAACTTPANNVSSSQPSSSSAPRVILTVSAGTSLQDALKAIAETYHQQKPEVTIAYNFGSSGSLQQQIEQGAPVDIFFSAAAKQMNALQDKNLLLPETRKDLLTNEVVLIVPQEISTVTAFEDLSKDEVEKIAIGDPESVPAGEYAKEVLIQLNLYDALQDKFIFAKDVRQVLSYVESGNVDAGIVYATDAKSSSKVTVATTAPAESHKPIVYPVAVLKDSKNPEPSQAFLEFLASEAALKIFEQYGFSPVESTP